MWWLTVAAFGQPVERIPEGTETLTVLLCPRLDGCAPEAAALAAFYTKSGWPLITFDQIAARGAAGDDALRRWEEALAALREAPDEETIAAARAALEGLPFTVPAEDLFEVYVRDGALALSEGWAAEARTAFERAASTSGERISDLPDVPEAATAAYLAVVDSRAELLRVRLEISADVDRSRVFVDGLDLGNAPTSIDVKPGWHRITVERAGRRTASVAEVEVGPAGAAHRIAVSGDDAAAGLQAAVIGEIHGVPAPADVADVLAGWGRTNGVEILRFVALSETTDAPEIPPLDRDSPGYTVSEVYLDVDSEAFSVDGGGPGRGWTPRVRVGVATGWRHVEGRNHAELDLPIAVLLGGAWSVQLQPGIAKSAEPYYLFEDQIDYFVFPAAVGVRYGKWNGGPFASLSALAVIPWSLGAELGAGYEVAPNRRLRFALEGRANLGFNDVAGAVYGAGIHLGVGTWL